MILLKLTGCTSRCICVLTRWQYVDHTFIVDKFDLMEVVKTLHNPDMIQNVAERHLTDHRAADWTTQLMFLGRLCVTVL